MESPRESALRHAWRTFGAARAWTLGVGLVGTLIAAAARLRLAADGGQPMDREAMAQISLAAAIGAIGANVILFVVFWMLAPVRQRNEAWRRIEALESDPVAVTVRRLRGVQIDFGDRQLSVAELFLMHADEFGGGYYGSRMVTELHKTLWPGSEFKALNQCYQALKVLLAENVIEPIAHARLDGFDTGARQRTTAHGRAVCARLRADSAFAATTALRACATQRDG